MSEACRTLREEGAGALPPARLEEHLANCAVCRRQVEADRRLRVAFSDLPGGEVPAGLETRLAARLRAAPQPARQPLEPAGRWGLAVYWLFAAAASAVVIAGFELPKLAPAAALASLTAVVLALAPTLLLAHRAVVWLRAARGTP